MSRSTIFIFSLFFCYHLNGQNLVPNSSFEKVNKITNGWIISDQVFEKRIQDWTSPNLGSPDIFFNKIMDNISPPRKGVDLFGHRARTGQMMVAIKTYGCQVKTQHCKEYIQIQLNEPILKGQEYYIEFWVNPMSTSSFVNNIGLVFSDIEIQDDSEYGIHYFDPVVNEKQVIKNKPNDWHRISAVVKADADYNYAIIGNFYTDSETEILATDGSIRYAYYLIDDVLIRPLINHNETDLASLPVEVGMQIPLNNIYFETGQSSLLDKSFIELDKLYKLLNLSPDLIIQIDGHTDNEGSEEENFILSKDRAESVANYLKQKGISRDRIKVMGFGETLPITSNETSEGRSLNRRVVCTVLEK